MIPTHPQTKYMALAISEAQKSHEKLPCGAVIVNGDEVIASAHNAQHTIPDVTAHAEILAIREACKKFKSKSLEGCAIYCTCEPCLMCLTAIIYAKITHVIYGSSLLEIDNKYKDLFIVSTDFLAKAPHPINITKDFLKENTDKLYF
jgi:guanine deaminase